MTSSASDSEHTSYALHSAYQIINKSVQQDPYKFARSFGTESPKNTTCGFSIPPQSEQDGTTKSFSPPDISTSPSGRTADAPFLVFYAECMTLLSVFSHSNISPVLEKRNLDAQKTLDSPFASQSDSTLTRSSEIVLCLLNLHNSYM